MERELAASALVLPGMLVWLCAVGASRMLGWANRHPRGPRVVPRWPAAVSALLSLGFYAVYELQVPPDFGVRMDVFLVWPPVVLSVLVLLAVWRGWGADGERTHVDMADGDGASADDG